MKKSQCLQINGIFMRPSEFGGLDKDAVYPFLKIENALAKGFSYLKCAYG